MNTSEKNIIELQSKVLFQEDTIERLSKEIRKQQLEISQLKEKVSLIIPVSYTHLTLPTIYSV